LRSDGIGDPAKRKRGVNSERANGRLAVFAIMGMMFQNGVTSTTGTEMWAPPAVFEQEFGIQALVGLDPLCFSKDGDVTKFKRRRKVELKHGRVAMLAAMGYIIPEYFLHPGLLSSSVKLKFADTPSGLAALSKMPLAGGL